MNLLDLFSGIGGFSLAARWAGIDTVAFCESDPFCQRVLRKNFGEDIIIHDDIKKMDGTFYRERISIVSGGFPCQPFSIAGKRRGTTDDRHLWPEMFRIINEIRPHYILGENVINFKSMALDTMLIDLESIGYEVQTFDIPASAVQLPTMERHLWIVASRNCKRSQRCIDLPVSWQCEIPREFQRDNSREFERWAVSEARVCRVDERIPHRVDRIRTLGNAIIPQVAYIIFSAMKSMEENI